jgi:hypothetical protein
MVSERDGIVKPWFIATYEVIVLTGLHETDILGDRTGSKLREPDWLMESYEN